MIKITSLTLLSANNKNNKKLTHEHKQKQLYVTIPINLQCFYPFQAKKCSKSNKETNLKVKLAPVVTRPFFMEFVVPNALHMLEYLEHAGIDIKQFVDEKSIKTEYLRQIYRVDARSKILNPEGKVVGKASNPRHLH